MVGVGGGGGGAAPSRPKKTSVTMPSTAVFRKDLLCRHIELSKGVKQCRKVVRRCFRYVTRT